MARAYFCAYYSYLDLFRELTDEEVGRLMRAVFIYAVDGMELDLPPVERMPSSPSAVRSTETPGAMSRSALSVGKAP